MQRTELADRLTMADEDEQTALLERHPRLADVGLARVLNAYYDKAKASDPKRASGTARALTALATALDDPEVAALADWTCGMAALQLDGHAEHALASLERAAERFRAVGQEASAAETQVSKVFALAMLGRYDEAVYCGREARTFFLKRGDLLAAGKIEQNLGNIYL